MRNIYDYRNTLFKENGVSGASRSYDKKSLKIFPTRLLV